MKPKCILFFFLQMNGYSFLPCVSQTIFDLSPNCTWVLLGVTQRAFSPLVQAEVFLCVPSLSGSPKAIPFTGLITRAAHCDTSWLTRHHSAVCVRGRRKLMIAVRTCCTPLSIEQNGGSLLLPYMSHHCLAQQFYTPCSFFWPSC